MTGLIPAYAKRVGIPCLFTVHNIHTNKVSMSQIEDRGIDAAEFWENLYFENAPESYEQSRDYNLVDMLNTGIFSSTFINTVSPTFLDEVSEGRHDFIPNHIRHEIRNKRIQGFASGILNAPNAIDNLRCDDSLSMKYNEKNFVEAKLVNKIKFQKECGLKVDPRAPILFWPSRLDPMQKGCQLLSDILYNIVENHSDVNMQVAIIANGVYQSVFKDIVHFHHLENRVAVIDFDDTLSHLGFGACDFVLMPSLFEPCGLPQMIGAIYGTLPIVHATGGLKDTISHLNVENNTGNGFIFNDYDSGALSWAIDEAVRFFKLDADVKNAQVKRVIIESNARFRHSETAAQYIKLYEKILHHSILND